LHWIAGFFDGEGSFSFAAGSPSVSLVNTDPQACLLVINTMRSYGIEAKINERSKPSKSSKKKRWDVFINQAEECIKFCKLMKPYIKGKTKQLDLILEYESIRKNTKQFHKRMMFLNQTNNILVLTKDKLIEKLGFVPPDEWVFEEYNGDNAKIGHSDFNNLYYLAGIIDAEGTININQRKNKHRNTDRFTPSVGIVNTNKEICKLVLSTIKLNNIGCHVQTRVPTNRNRIRWDLCIGGVNRVFSFGNIMIDKVRVKHKQLELLLSYAGERTVSPKSVNLTGYVTKMAIQSLR
jgi:hypothetical protein